MFVLMCLATQTPASAGTTEKYQSLNSTVRAAGEVIPEIQDASDSDANEMLCLALNIYHESRGEKAVAQWAVGFVTLNRVKTAIWGNSVCAVVWAKSQFSWTVRGMGTLVPKEVNAWKEAQRKAFMLFRGQKADDPTHGGTHFYLASIHPSWTRMLVDKMRIGAHMFARLPGRRAGN
jgi:spore germination cell wall hydrolase CwlJ-like protein